MFSKDDFHALARLLSELNGKFLVSLNDVPEVRGTFKTFNVEPVQVRYSCSDTRQRMMANELFITNYER